MSSPRTSSLCAIAAILVSVLLAGCVTQGAPPAARTAAHPAATGQPAGFASSPLVGNQVLDSDGNGYPDTFDATVYLFADNYVYTIVVPGTLSFTLADRTGKPISHWTFEKDKTARLAAQLPPGPGYALRLSLNDVGG